MKTVTLDVRSLGRAMSESLAAAKSGRPAKSARISFATPELLWRVLTAKRWEILKALSSGGADQMFSTRNEKRGDNLFNGGNVLQVGAHCVGEREWVVRFNVGAHMKAFSYNCYLKMTVGSNIFASTCECVGG